MPRPRVTIGAQSDLSSVGAAVGELQRLLGLGLQLGDPRPPAATTVTRQTIGAVIRPAQTFGQADNLQGAWCEAVLDTVGDLAATQNLRFYHGLNRPVPASRVGRNQTLNVRWTLMGLRYNTNVAAPASIITNVNVAYVDGAVDSDWIELRVWTGDAAANVLTLAGANAVALVPTLYFWPASR